MANRTFNDAQALEKEIKTLFVKIEIGASGAPTLVKGLGTSTVTRTSDGLYEVTLEDAYPFFMGFEGTLLKATVEDLTFQLTSETVLTNKKFSFMTKAAAVATDPSSGSVLYLTLHMKNTSVKF